MQLKRAQRFEELIVYQKVRALSRDIFEVSKRFPREETYSLVDQIRRASRSIGAHIAEAWGKRRYPKNFISKLTDADSEQLETQHRIATAQDCNYLGPEEAVRFQAACEEVGRMLGALITRMESAYSEMPRKVEEEVAPYEASPWNRFIQEDDFEAQPNSAEKSMHAQQK